MESKEAYAHGSVDQCKVCSGPEITAVKTKESNAKFSHTKH